MGRPLIFWFEFASTYSYLSALRIEAEAAARDVTVVWRPFLLGPIFQAQGWATSPFNLYPAKGRYMVRDIERLAAERGLGFRLPDPFPQQSLKAARIATVGVVQGWVAPFAKAVFVAEFAQGHDISNADVLARVLNGLGLNAMEILQTAESVETKQALRAATDAAQHAGIFGAPSFSTEDGELFWGDDRLEAALSWVARR